MPVQPYNNADSDAEWTTMRMHPVYVCVLAAIGALSGPALAAVPAHTYDALIIQARSGVHEPALAMLRQHAIEHPMDLRAVYDHILIASWANRPAEAIAAYEAVQPAPNHPPADVLDTLARAYRDSQRWDEALLQFRRGRMLYPEQDTFAAGEVMTLADAGRPQEAIALGKSLIKAKPENADLRLALGYAYKGVRSPHPVLEAADRAHHLAPQKDYVTREYIASLHDSELAHAALLAAQDNPGLLPPSTMRDLEADYVAELVRLAAMPARQENERYAIADRALAEYDRLIPAWTELGPEAQADVLRLRFDRLQALHSRHRMQDVVDGYEALRAEGHDVPRYVLNDVASAYLDLRQPDIAIALFNRSMQHEASRQDSAGERLTNETGLYYALIENEDFDAAQKVMEDARAQQPTWRRIKGVKQRVPNDLHLYSEQTAALGLFYVDDNVAAQERLEELVARAPRNVGLKVALANVYRGRGWPRLAEQELKMAEALEPLSVEVEAGQGLTALQLHEWQQARLLTEDLDRRFPEHLSSRDLRHEWELHNKAELHMLADHGIASDSPVTGSNDLSMETVLYSAPLNEFWRVFGGVGYASGEFEEGSGSYRWARTGAEWRARGLTAEIEASSHNYGHGTKPGARVSIDYELNDHWAAGGSAEWRSRETPLRALRNDISANAASAYIQWHHSDQRDWRFSFAPSRFSDGNTRLFALLSGRERLYTGAHLKADLHMNVAASKNSRDDAPYFNPKSDLEIMPSVTLTHLLYRHYETEWEQRFILGAGTYYQEDYGTGVIGALGYGMNYRYNDVFDIGATVTGVSRPYDGVRERELRVVFEMTFRF